MLTVSVFLSLVSVTLGGAKLDALKGEIATLEESFAQVLEDTNGGMEELEASIAEVVGMLNTMKAEQAQKDIDLAWQALHMTGAAAC